MKVTLESTTKLVNVNGVQCRIWEGKTANGIPMHAYIVRVAVANPLDATEFERDLKECKPPSATLDAIPLRFLIDD